MRIDDPDRPLPYETYAAIASYVRHHGRCQVHATSLPYGMWWSELRPSIDLVLAPVDGPIDDPTGVWAGPNEWISADHEGYAESADHYWESVDWLDPENASQPENAGHA